MEGGSADVGVTGLLRRDRRAGAVLGGGNAFFDAGVGVGPLRTGLDRRIFLIGDREGFAEGLGGLFTSARVRADRCPRVVLGTKCVSIAAMEGKMGSRNV